LETEQNPQKGENFIPVNIMLHGT